MSTSVNSTGSALSFAKYMSAGMLMFSVITACNDSGGSNFTPPQLTVPLLSITDPRAVLIADLNKDNVLDIAALHLPNLSSNPSFTGSNVVSVLLGVGDGTFLAKKNLAVGDQPKTVTAGDLNGDGHLDLVTVNVTSISVLLNNGDGTFQQQQNFPVSTGLLSASLANLNEDDALDVISLKSTNNTPEICVLLGSGTVVFGMPQCFSIPSNPNLFTNSPFVAATADFNNDGHADLITGNSQDLVVQIHLGNGDGTFQSPRTTATNGVPHAFAIDDVNSDGVFDIVAADGAFNHISLLLGNGDGSYQASKLFSSLNRPTSIATAKIDTNDSIDLVVLSPSLNKFQILIGDGSAFVFNQPFPLVQDISAAPISITVADLNVDGKNDVITTNVDSFPGTISVFLGNGDGTFQAERHFDIGE